MRDNFRFSRDRYHTESPGLKKSLGSASVQEPRNEGNHQVLIQRFRPSILSVIVALWPTSIVSCAPSQETEPASDDWVQQVAPGIRIVGQSNLSAMHFTNSNYAMTEDGNFLLGCRGRRLVLLDWEAQKVVREIDLPTRAISGHVRFMCWSQDRENVIVVVNWQGRPYQEDDGTDLDDEDIGKQFQEYSPFKFYGTRVLVYGRNWQLKHDIELIPPSGKEREAGPIGRQQDYESFRLLSDDRTLVAIGGPEAKVIDIQQGKVTAEQPAVRDAQRISAAEFGFGHPLRIWNVKTNTIQSADSLNLPPNFRLGQVDPTNNLLVYQQAPSKETYIWNRRTGTRTLISKQSAFNGCFSSSGDLYFFSAPNPDNNTTTASVYDTVREEVITQVNIDGYFGQRFFRPGHRSLMVRNWNDASLSEVSIDQHFAANLSRSVNRLPNFSQLGYIDRDQKLILREGNCWLTTDSKCDVHRGSVWGRAFSPTNPQLIVVLRELSGGSGNGEHEVAIADLDDMTGKKVRKLYSISPIRTLETVKSLLNIPQEYRPGITSYKLEFDPTGEIVRDLYAEGHHMLRLRQSDAKSGRKISEVLLNSRLRLTPAAAGAISPNGLRVAVGQQNNIELFDATTGDLLRELTLPDSGQRIASLKLDRRGEYMATALFQPRTITQVMVHRVLDGQEVFSYSGKDTVSIGFQPGTDRFYILTSDEQNQLRFFDRDTWQETWRHATTRAPAYGMAMSSTGQEIAIGLKDSRVEFWTLSDIRADKP